MSECLTADRERDLRLIGCVSASENPNVPWDDWVAEYARVRDAIEATYPDLFARFNKRLFEPGGMVKPLPARTRIWKTMTGKANFIAPAGLEADPDLPPAIGEILDLITLRSNDHFNTTIHGYDDRFRGRLRHASRWTRRWSS